MEDIRGSISRLKKDIKHRLSGSKHKGDRSGTGGRVERVEGSGSLPRPEVGVATSGTHGQEGNVSDAGDESVGPRAVVDENRSDRKSTASASTKLLLRGVRDSADAFGPLKSIAGGLCFILDNYERTKANKQAIESLAPRVKALAERLCESVPEGDVKEQERRERLEQKFQDVLRDLAPLKEQGEVEGFFNNVENAGKLGSLVEDIRDAMMEYQTSLQQGIYDKQQGIYDKQQDIYVKQRDIDDKSRLLIESADLVLLNGLCHTVNAGHHSGNRQGCLRGTREGVLRDIEDWFSGDQGQRVFWLNGLAGTGKSTIAQTFAETTFADGKLGASFFCSRDFEDRSNLQMIFPTLAFQLACQYPCLRKELLRVLRERPDIGHESLCSQIEKLLVGPLKVTAIPTLIVIDALDECKDKEPASAILSILSRYVDQIPNVKFFITGRPEPRIRSGFRLQSLAPITGILKLHEVKPEAVSRDIALFFQTQLASLTKNRSDFDLTVDWPSPSDIKILCKKAAGFFIYASTVVKFIASESNLPTERLALIISLPQSTIEEGKSGVDQLYTKVLQQAFSDVHTVNSQQYLHFQSVVGTVLLIFNPLSIKSLSELLGYNAQYIQSTMRSLHSLLLIPGNTKDSVRVFHKSFPDFLMDPDRCEDKRFLVEPTSHHAEILLACLRLMGNRLKKNICNLDDYAVLSEVKDLSTQKKVYIGDALEYACQFWTKHLLGIPGDSPYAEEVQEAIDEFFTVHLLHWIEVLALTKSLGTGVYAMNDIEQWYNLAGVVSKWTNDSWHFLLEHFDTIQNSPSHIYHSALHFSPSTSWLHKYYSSKLSVVVRVVKGLPAKWGTCFRTIFLDGYTPTLSFLNNTIAVGAKPKNIIILNVITGSQTAVLSGHTGEVNCLTFSPDGTSLVSGSDDRTAKLWDVQTGGVVKTFSGHSGWVWSVSISADHTTIASGSVDGKICLWDIQTGGCYHTIKQQGIVYHVGFSPTNPQHFISICDKMLWQWDTDGHPIKPPLNGSCTAFSSNGTQFVSCYGAVVKVQNTDSGAIVAEFQVANRNTKCCCFSPDGRLVAVAANNTAYVWDITNPNPHLVETFIDHTENITSLAFSSPSTLISASEDKSAKFWQICTLPTDQVVTNPGPTQLTSPLISSISLKARDGIAISSDVDGVVKTWDIPASLWETSFQTPAKDYHHGDVIHTRLIFIWYAEERINIWDARGERFLLQTDVSEHSVLDLRISGDGSKIFYIDKKFIQAWDMWTGEAMGKVEFKGYGGAEVLSMDNSRVWMRIPGMESSAWDFGIPGPSPIELSTIPSDRLHLNDTKLWDNSSCRIQDKVTGKVIFQLPGGFQGPVVEVQWDGQYLAISFKSRKELILEFYPTFLFQ